VRKGKNRNCLQQGFSLVEILIVVLIMSIVMIALYDLFDANNKIHAMQQQVTTMNLRTRTAMAQMVTAIRTSGSNHVDAIRLDGQPFIPRADANAVRVVEDLPMDVWNTDCTPNTTGGNGSTFERCDANSDTDVADDNENENADGFINDYDEDVTFSLIDKNSLNITGPCTLSLEPCSIIKTQFADSTYCPNVTPGCQLCPGNCPATTSQVIATNIESLTFEYFLDTTASPMFQAAAPVTGNTRFDIKLVRITLNARTAGVDMTSGLPRRLELKSDVFLRN
jgi:prepilin-type N-terminal cleavage/methylation domain-containing protein